MEDSKSNLLTNINKEKNVNEIYSEYVLIEKDIITIRYYSVDIMMKYVWNLPVKYIFLEYLKNKLDALCWKDDIGQAISPNMVMNNMDLFSTHAKKITAADLKQPILVSENRSKIYDGMYRLAKSFKDKHFFIKSISVPYHIFSASQVNIEL